MLMRTKTVGCSTSCAPEMCRVFLLPPMRVADRYLSHEICSEMIKAERCSVSFLAMCSVCVYDAWGIGGVVVQKYKSTSL